MTSSAFDSILLELRISARVARRSPAFAALLALTLGVGVGANGAVFSALDRFLLAAPGGIDQPEQVKRVHQHFLSPLREHQVREAFAPSEFEAITRVVGNIGMAGFIQTQTVLGQTTTVREARIDYVVGDFFGLLGTRAAIGRLLHKGDIDGAAPVAVISFDLWSSRFGRAWPLNEQKVTIAGHDFQIVGVVEKDFKGVGLSASQAWVPYGTPGSPFHQSGTALLSRNPVLKVLIRVPQFSQQTLVAMRLKQALSDRGVVRDTAATVVLETVSNRLGAGKAREQAALSILALASAVILLIACVNAAILVLLRSARRRRETAIRFALGIPLSRLTIQLIAETALLGATALVIGIVASSWTGHLLRTNLVPGTLWGSSPLNARVVLVVAGFAFLTSGLSATVPVILAYRAGVSERIRGGLGFQSTISKRMRIGLLALQAFLVVLLLSPALVFAHSLRNVMSIPTGYASANVFVVSAPSFGGAVTGVQGALRTERLTKLMQAVRQTVGVDLAALSSAAPGSSIGFAALFTPSGDTLPTTSGNPTVVAGVSPEYLQTLGMRIVEGRGFGEFDHAGAVPVIVVSEMAAKRYWPQDRAIGKCVIVLRRSDPCRFVVGVVNDTRVKNLEAQNASVYLPILQAPGHLAVPTAVVFRASQGVTRQVILGIRRNLIANDPEAANWPIRSLSDLLTSQLGSYRINAFVFAGLGILALLISGIGIFGTTSYLVGELTQEIGLRRALGADGTRIGVLVARQSVLPVLAGLMAGLSLTLALRDVTSSAVFGTSPASLEILIGVGLVLLVATGIACFGPMLRALRVSPLAALNTE